MGIPSYSQFSNSFGIGTSAVGSNYYTYDNPYSEEKPYIQIPTTSPPSPPQIQSVELNDQTLKESSFFRDYLDKGFSTSFVQKYDRELTIAASSLSVLILLIIGACVWCLLGILKRGRDDDDDEDGEKAGAKGDAEDGVTDEMDSSCGLSDVSVEAGNTGKKFGATGGTKKKIPIISKIFSKHNGNGTKILAQHRNIITPDKNIPFIVPTIQLPAQPATACRKPEGSVLCDDHHHPSTSSEPQPSTSRGPQGLLLAQQFFPQLEHPECDSCPLIAFTLFYELSTQILNVRLLEGRNFPETVNHTVSVKIYPGRSAKQTTKEFRARSPVYNVEFCYHVRKSSLQTKILKLRAVIPGSPKRIIGYVNVALKDLPGFDSATEEITEDLKTTQLWRRVELPSELGDGVKLQVSVKWSPEPSPGFLTLKIIEAAGLHENRDCDYSSSYIKVTLQEQGRNIKTRKTQLVRWGSVPVFDDVFVLTIPRELLSQISFLLVVIARGRLGSKAVLGKITIGPVPYSVIGGGASGRIVSTDGVGGGAAVVTRASTQSSSSSASSTGTEIWEDMCHQPDTEIIRWLHLLP